MGTLNDDTVEIHGKFSVKDVTFRMNIWIAPGASAWFTDCEFRGSTLLACDGSVLDCRDCIFYKEDCHAHFSNNDVAITSLNSSFVSVVDCTFEDYSGSSRDIMINVEKKNETKVKVSGN